MVGMKSLDDFIAKKETTPIPMNTLFQGLG